MSVFIILEIILMYFVCGCVGVVRITESESGIVGMEMDLEVRFSF